MNMTAEEFTKRVGRPPENDDLERVNCPSAGEIGHSDCGWCDHCNHPKFECLCKKDGKIIFIDGKLVPDLSDMETYNKVFKPELKPVNEPKDMLDEIFADREKDPEFQDEMAKLRIGYEISRERLNCNMSQEKLAEKAGIHVKHIWALEDGKSISLANLWRIAKALNMVVTLEPRKEN